MENPICISTGCVHKLSNDRNVLIGALRVLSPMGIEISFAHPDYLLNLNISKSNLDYLRSLKFNSIHSPWQDIVYGANKTSSSVLRKMSELYKQINAKNVVFHRGQIDDYGSILNNDFTASIENDDWKTPGHNVKDIKDILNKYKKFSFTLDFAHALSVSPLDISEYINCFKDRLSEIHISRVDKKNQKHDFLHKYDAPELRELLGLLKAVTVPVVLEGVISDYQEIHLLRKEIEYIKRSFRATGDI